MAWGTSSAWQVGQQKDIRRSTCGRNFIPTGIGLYLQEFTLGVHEVDYLVGQLQGELDRVLHYHDALLIDSMQRASGAYTCSDGGWSKGCFTLIRMPWDPGIDRFLPAQIVQRSGLNQWHIWDLGITGDDSGD